MKHKCIICNHQTAVPYNIAPELVELIQNNVAESILDNIAQDICECVICELCWYGTINSGWDYIWNGIELMVYDRSEDEWFEYHGSRYKPSKGSMIVFEWCEASKKWLAMPRGGAK